MDPNQFMNFYQMFMQQNPQMMGMNPGMMGMNPGMMGMNPGMMGMNPGMMGMNPGIMGMNPGMMGMNNMDINSIANMLMNMGFNQEMINNFVNMYSQYQQQQESKNNNTGNINLTFKQKSTQKSVIIITNYNETLGSVIGRYISKTGDNSVNLYICNSKKLNESLTVGEAGLMNYSIIDVVRIDELEGAIFN